MKKFIALEGIMGTGKTTTANEVYKKLVHYSENINPVFPKPWLIFEKSVDNPLISDFYKSMDSDDAQQKTDISLMAEINFSIGMNVALSEIHRLNPYRKHIIITDFSPHKCKIFSKLNLIAGDYKIFEDIHDRLNIRYWPDLVIYLRIPIDVALARMQMRGRHFELDVKKQYLENLQTAYDYAAKGSTLGNRTIRLDLDGSESIELVSDEVTNIIREYAIKNVW